VPPITDVRDISRIGYGFMASRALFAALDADVFGRLANGPKTLDARDVGWPADNDVVLMSYLLSAVSETATTMLLGRAYKALRPGGRLLVHDFMVDDDHAGPPLAALWLLNAITIDADVAALTPTWLMQAARGAGFGQCDVTPVVPGTTRLLSARR
jgi:2-hydroxy-4-(methylsulfanyl)butanoate S-methyltransferase